MRALQRRAHRLLQRSVNYAYKRAQAQGLCARKHTSRLRIAELAPANWVSGSVFRLAQHSESVTWAESDSHKRGVILTRWPSRPEAVPDFVNLKVSEL